ncbi:MAG: cysteine-rich CWC family protein [Bacteroidota bacterium]
MNSLLNKKCPNCGRKFTCTGDDDCWCESVKLNRKEMIQVMMEFNDCLCPGCLKNYESE